MIGCKVMRTLASVEFESIVILGLSCCLSSSSVQCLENLGYSVPNVLKGSLCPSCNAHRMDQWGDHAVHCSSEVGVKFRHNLVRDILVDICSKVGIMVIIGSVVLKASRSINHVIEVVTDAEKYT
ncbi:hypothetical protein Tco_0871401, partial [Tanacetum coccineum]